MKRPNQAALDALVEDWNSKHPVGTRVETYRLVEPRREPRGPSTTRSEAFVLGGHTAAVMVVGVSGCVSLDSVEVLA